MSQRLLELGQQTPSPSGTSEYVAWEGVMAPLGEYRSVINAELTRVVEEIDESTLNEEARHAVLSGGKRIRPTITLLAAEAVGSPQKQAVEQAVAIELIHNASLLVDDIIDRSTLRRGADSGWVAHGHDATLATSDGLIGEAFARLETETATQIAAQAIVELSQGEAMELATTPDGWQDYRQLAKYKTGALFRAAAELGALSGECGAQTRKTLGEYGERVGIAFQIKDDVLDVTAASETLGKPTNKDEATGRPSVIHATDLSTEHALRQANVEADEAITALNQAATVEPAARQRLADIAEFAVTREY